MMEPIERFAPRSKISVESRREIDDFLSLSTSLGTSRFRRRRRFYAYGLIISGVPPQEVADRFGRSLSWVMKLISDEKKCGAAAFRSTSDTKSLLSTKRVQRNRFALTVNRLIADKKDNTYSLKDIINIVQDKHGIAISTNEAWRVVQKAKEFKREIENSVRFPKS